MTSIDNRVLRHLCVGFDGPTVPDALADLLRRGVRSVVLFSRNYESPGQVRDLCRAIRALTDESITIAVDHEGGRVQRFREGFTPIPSMREVGERDDPAYAESIGRTIGRELRAVGIDMNFAPVLDIDTNPDNPVIGERSFGRDPERVAELGAAFIRGMQSEGVAACAKHFPGHGDTSVDSHFELPTVPHDLERLRQIELIPFKRAIEAGVAAIMTAHIMLPAIDPDRPATLSRRIVTGLLREELGFEGTIFADDLEMHAIAKRWGIAEAAEMAIEAGCDVAPVCGMAHRAWLRTAPGEDIHRDVRGRR